MINSKYLTETFRREHTHSKKDQRINHFLQYSAKESYKGAFHVHEFVYNVSSWREGTVSRI